MNLKNRLRFDIFMTALLAFEMFYEMTGNTLHEIVGAALFGTIAVHLALSAKWARSTSRSISAGRASKRGIVHAVFGIVLLLAFIPLVVSSIAVSHILSGTGLSFTFLFTYTTWAAIHTFTAYLVCALTVVHLAMHWKSFVKAFHVPYDPSRRAAIGTCVGAVAGLGVIALSVTGANAMRALALPESDSAGASQGDSMTTDEMTISDKALKSASPESGVSTGSSASNASSSGSSSSTSSASSASSSPTVTGTCTLCKKRCPLSSPQCRKPYEAGLI